MKLVLFFFSTSLILLSCGNSHKAINESNTHSLPACGGNYNQRDLEERREYRDYKAVSQIGIIYVIKGADTLRVNELICVDSIKFTTAFNDLPVSPMCIEMGVQGKTYFSARTNKYAGFEEIKVLRGVDPCLKYTEDKIKERVVKMRMLSEEYGNCEVEFFHMLRLY